MTEPGAVSSSRFQASMIGPIYFLYFSAAIFAAFLAKGYVVTSDAAATAAGI